MITQVRVKDLRTVNNALERVRWCDTRWNDPEPAYRGNAFIASEIGKDPIKLQAFMFFYCSVWNTITMYTDRYYDLRVSFETPAEGDIFEGGNLIIPFRPSFVTGDSNVIFTSDFPRLVLPGGGYKPDLELKPEEVRLISQFFEGTYSV